MEEPTEEETYYQSPEEEPFNYLSRKEYTSSLFNAVVTVQFLMFYSCGWWYLWELFRELTKGFKPLFLFLVVSLLIILFYLDNEEVENIKIISPTPTNMEFSEQEPFHQSSEGEMVILFNVLMIGTILLFYLLLLFPNLGLFRGLCNFLLFGFFSLTIMIIFIFADDPKKEASWVLSNRIDKDNRKPGDHIYTWRGAYAHHGICTGDGNVIHIVRGAGQGYGIETGLYPFNFNSSSSHLNDNRIRSCTSCGDQSNLEGVISSCIECFLSRGDLYLFQYFVTPTFFFTKVRGGACTLIPSDPLEVVLNRAKDLLHTNGFGVYHILRNNCESFAYYCKTGLSFFSGQVLSFYFAALFLAFLLLPDDNGSDGLTTMLMGITLSNACQYIIETESSDQPLKVPVERLRLWQLWNFGLNILLTMMGMHRIAYQILSIFSFTKCPKIFCSDVIH